MSTTIIYNNIRLSVCRLHTYHREPVFDRAGNYLYTDFYLVCTAILNPQATSYAAVQAGPGFLAGEPAPRTDAAIRHALSQPRKTLLVSIADIPILRSPAQNHTVDAHLGPVPKVYSVDYHGGQKTMQVTWGVHTRINECDRFASSPPVILSHTWEMAHSIDQDFMTQRVIRGRAVFHMGRLLALGNNITADNFRASLFHPVPQNFQRVQIDVHQTEDPSEIYYTLVDKERPIQIQAAGVTRIEAWLSHAGRRLGAESILLGSLKKWVDFSASLGSTIWDPGAWLREIGNILQAGYEAAPRSSVSIIIRVWGRANSVRNDLIKITYGMADKLLNQAFDQQQKVALDAEGNLEFDVMGKWVQLKLDLSFGPVAFVAKGLSVTAQRNYGPDAVATYTTDTGANPAPPNDSNSRGTYVGKVIARAFASECARPSAITPPTDVLASEPLQ